MSNAVAGITNGWLQSLRSRTLGAQGFFSAEQTMNLWLRAAPANDPRRIIRHLSAERRNPWFDGQEVIPDLGHVM